MALGAEPAAQASESRFILRYEELEDRIKAENPQAEMERIPYESRIAALEEAKADLAETRKFLRSEASDREDAGDAAGADHYRGQADTLFVFDEPTIGLHPLDVATLLGVFQTLLDQGATVVVIEHDLDVIRSADYLIDLGPGGGQAGGRIVAAGTPAQVAACPESVTGR